MLIRPPTEPQHIPPEAEGAAKIMLKLASDIAPVIVPPIATMMAYIDLINAALATVSALLGIAYMAYKLYRLYRRKELVE